MATYLICKEKKLQLWSLEKYCIKYHFGGRKIHIFWKRDNTNRLLYNRLYNMEFYCTSPYCVEIRIGRDAKGVESNTGFSTQHGRVIIINLLYS